MKKISEWLNEIADPEIRRRALINFENRDKTMCLDVAVRSERDAIGKGFSWNATPELGAFWEYFFLGRFTTWQEALEKYPHLRQLQDANPDELKKGIPPIQEVKKAAEKYVADIKAKKPRTIESITADECVRVDNAEEDLRFRKLLKAAGLKWCSKKDYVGFTPKGTAFNKGYVKYSDYPRYHFPYNGTWDYSDKSKTVIHCSEFFEVEEKVDTVDALNQINQESNWFGKDDVEHNHVWNDDKAVESAIELLKSNGYKVLKPVTNFEEV